MRLYVVNPETDEKIYLNVMARTRQELAKEIGSDTFTVKKLQFDVNSVMAESSDNMAVSMAVGGVVGLLAGFPGVALGSLVGALLGKQEKMTDEEKSEIFNRS
ncbi:MAG: hypothetical protein Tsb002_01150 [Wenzhouxiangellaceae bacterium]